MDSNGFSGNLNFNNSQSSSGNIPTISSLNLDNSQSETSQSQGQQQQNVNLFSSQSFAFPPNFDLNSLSPAERELLLRRLQQQQQQLQRARQQQLQQAQAQRMTMNAYSTPRPPLSAPNNPNITGSNPIVNNQYFVNPVNQMGHMTGPVQMMGYPQNYLVRPVLGGPGVFPSITSNPSSNGINPALLQNQHQQQQQQQQQGIKQINPQQFTNPLANVPLKSDPVLYTVQSAPPQPQTPQHPQSHQTQQAQSLSLNLPQLDEQILSSEGNFIEHLIKFLDAIKFTNRVVPQLANRPISLHRLFTVVTSLGGFLKVGETKKWPIVAHSLQLPANSYEIVSTVRATYYTFLYTYEQYFVQKRTLDKIDWPNQPKVQQATTAAVPSTSATVPASQSKQSVPATAQPAQNTQSQPIPPVAVPFNPQNLKFIPENELSLWKSFADGMKIPIYPILDIETAILYINSPYFILKVESLLTTQRLFAQLTPKDLQTAGLSVDSLSNLLRSLETLWSQSVQSIPTRQNKPNKPMEDFWAEADSRKREFMEIENDLSFDKRDAMICKLISNLLRTITVTKGSDVSQFLSRSTFIKTKLLPFALMECDDLEIYKDALIIFESISPHLNSGPLLNWEFKQCQLELNQCRVERLTTLVSKFTGTLNLDRIRYFDNLISARQTVSALITQCAHLWKSIPAHVFLHLSTCLSLLTSLDDTPDIDLKSLALEIEKFMSIFVLPIVSLLRSVRALYECTSTFSNSQDEVRRVLETVIYSANFSLTDGGFMEICLQILLKCRDNHVECLDQFDWTGVILILRELREFWRHSNPESVPNLGKVCYQTTNLPVSGSPAKKISTKVSLAILNGSSNIPAIFSHPFLLLCKSLDLLANSFPSLPAAIKLELLELAVEWNLETPSKWGSEVLGSERLEESLKTIREFYF